MKRTKRKGLFLSICLLALGLTYAVPAHGPSQIQDLISWLAERLTPDPAVDGPASESALAAAVDRGSDGGGGENGGRSYSADGASADDSGRRGPGEGPPLICEDWNDAGACIALAGPLAWPWAAGLRPGWGGVPGGPETGGPETGGPETGAPPAGFGSGFDPVALLPDHRSGYFPGLFGAVAAGSGGTGGGSGGGGAGGGSWGGTGGGTGGGSGGGTGGGSSGGGSGGGTGGGRNTPPQHPAAYAAVGEAPPVAVPEPASGALLLFALGALGLMIGRRPWRRRA